jgi:NarL family two-component system response regulator LiaR
MMPVRIAIADDHRLVARSLEAYLESFPDMTVVGIAASGEELLEHVAEWQPDVLLQDLILPGGWDGIETTRQVLKRCPRLRVVAITASVDEARMVGVLRAGALGYVRKDAEPEVLLAAVRAVSAGRTYLDPQASHSMVSLGGNEDALSPRELEVLRALATGQSNKEIARTLVVSEETVKTHVGHILAKLRVENRAQAIVTGLKRGVLLVEDL